MCETLSQARTGNVLALQGYLPRGKLACLSGRCLVKMKTESFSFGESRITEQCNCEVDNEAKVASSSNTVARWITGQKSYHPAMQINMEEMNTGGNKNERKATGNPGGGYCQD